MTFGWPDRIDATLAAFEDRLQRLEDTVERRQMLADHDRKRQEIRFAPWQMALTGMATGAAFFAAGVAFMRVMS